MGFVNEYVPKEDIEKYGLEEISKRYHSSSVQPDWTIHREQNIYLRRMRAGREEFCNEIIYTLFWKGFLLDVRITVLDVGGERGGSGWAKYRLDRLELPEKLRQDREEIIQDLEESLVAQKGSGVYSTFTDFTATFEFSMKGGS